MFKNLIMELRQKDLEINELINKIHSSILELNFDFKCLVRYDSNYADSILFIDLVYYNRNISSFRVKFDEETNTYKILRIDINTSDYNTNGTYLPVITEISRFETELTKLFR